MNKIFHAKVLIFSGLLLALFSYSFSAFALNHDNSVAQLDEGNETLVTSDFPELIESYRTDVVVNPDNTIQVTETITYNFNDLEKHGIYRIIPIKTSPGAIRKLKISDISVVDEHGNSYTTDISKTGEIRIKIGDADKTITGIHTYIIKYTALNAIGYFDTFDEIYWNSTGHEWEVPIWEAETRVFLPGNIENSDLRIASYCGEMGSVDPCIQNAPVYNKDTNQTEIVFRTSPDVYYEPGEGVTVAVGFPKGIVVPTMLKWYEKPESYIYLAYGIGALFLLLLLRLIFVVFLPEYRKRKRPIVTEFIPPEGMVPSQAGIVYRWFIGQGTMISADMLHLASIGYITIHSTPISLSKNKETSAFQRKINIIVIIFTFLVFSLVLWSMFSFEFFIIISAILLVVQRKKINTFIFSLKNPVEFSITRNPHKDISDMPSTLSPLYELISKDGVSVTLDDIAKEKKYYKFKEYLRKVKSLLPESTSKSLPLVMVMMMLFFAVPFVGFFVIFFNLMFTAPIEFIYPVIVLVAGFFLYKIVGAVFSFKLSKMTDSWYSVAGLYQYIKIAEKNRIEFESDPKKAEIIFSTLLPYAVAFGLEEKWIQVFNGIMINPPEYYSGGSISTMSASIGAFAGTMSSTASAGAPSSSGGGSSGSSGGGSSGGGGGGGGGGSW